MCMCRVYNLLRMVYFCYPGAALVNFSEDCPKNILTIYLDAIMGKLEAILSAKFTEVCVFFITIK
jgi:hypothetical protein